MHEPIILIGPIGTGKTTLAALLAEKLGITHHELDEYRWTYYNEIGYDQEAVDKIQAEKDFLALYRYWKPFEIHAVERVLADCPDGVISFGAGHSVYEDEALLERARHALAPYDNVILILPCEDLDEAATFFKARHLEEARQEGFEVWPDVLELMEHFVRHPSNRSLAKHVIYTQGKTPEQSCAEIIQLIGR